jgi:L-asparaginase II
MPDILAKVYRNRTVESVHYGSIVVSDKDGNVLFYHGDANLITYTRSSAKAFQFLPVYESGAVKRFGFSLQQIAIMLGSHTGTPQHEQMVKSNLDLIGLDESYLKCGTHVPIDYQQKGYIPYEGQKFSPLAHNCSGKHSGQLALALHIGDDPKNYIDPDSKTQQLVRHRWLLAAKLCAATQEHGEGVRNARHQIQRLGDSPRSISDRNLSYAAVSIHGLRSRTL